MRNRNPHKTVDFPPDALRRSLCAYARRRTGDADLAEDLTQEALTRAYERCGAADDVRNLNAYVWRVMVNLCHDVVRERRGGGTPSSEHVQDAREPLEPSPEELFVDCYEYQQILSAIHALPSAYRETLLLRCLEEMSYDDIAHVLGVSRAAVKKRLRLARQMLAARLNHLGIELPTDRPDCRRCRLLLSPFLDSACSFAEVEWVHRHVDRCAACEEAVMQWDAVDFQLNLALKRSRDLNRIIFQSPPATWRRWREWVFAHVEEAENYGGEMNADSAIPGENVIETSKMWKP